MKTRSLLPFLILALLLVACGGQAATPAAKPAIEASPPTVIAPAGEQQPAESPSEPPAAPVEAAPAGGPGEFDLAAPETGLENLETYRAVLEITLDGTRSGQPFRLQRSYIQDVDRSQNARLLTEQSTDVEGPVKILFAGLVGPVRYVQPAQDQPCQASLAAQDPGPLLEPAMLLPRMVGAEAAGEEAVGGIATSVYTFDQRALGVEEVAEANGKVWIAQDGGYVVKYELTVRSEVIFGDGVSAAQTTLYGLGEVNTLAVTLPESCPQPLVDMPVPPDAQSVARLADSVQFQTGLSPEALGAFYAEQMPALGWAVNDEPPASDGLWRWVYSRQASQGQTVAMISAKPAEGGLQVRIYQVQTEIGTE